MAPRLHESLLASPAYLTAGLLHLLVLLALSLVTVAVAIERQQAPVSVRLVASAEATLPPPPVATALADAVAPPDLDASTRPEVASDDVFAEALGDVAGHRAGVAAAAFGVGGAPGGGGRGGARDGRGGDSSGSRGALHAGLAWLARHRTPDGAWAMVGMHHAATKRLPAQGDVACTGLALLAFLFAAPGEAAPGEAARGAQEDPYAPVRAQATTWLRQQVGRDGAFLGAPETGYHQAIGTLALAEALQRGGADDPDLKLAAARAARRVQELQGDRGWRYRRGMDPDTSVTSWMVLALLSAEHAGLRIDASAFERVRRYLEDVSGPQGTTGYMNRARGSAAMNATGLFLRIVLGEAPTSRRNRAAAALVARETTVGPGVLDLYQLYYALLGMYQVGGQEWARFNPRVRDGLIACQERGDGCERGAWLPMQGHLNDPVLTTAVACLCLETYYRYLPVHEGAGPAEPGEPAAEAAPLPAPVAALVEAERLLGAATEAKDDRALLLVAEEALTRALDGLAAARPDALEGHDPTPLVAAARARLVEVAARLGDGEGAGPREPIEPLVLRARRAGLLARAAVAVEAAAAAAAAGASRAAPPASATAATAEAAAAAAEAALGAATAALADEVRRGDPDEAGRAAARERLEALRVRLALAANDEAGLEALRAAVDARPPAGEVGASEAAALRAVVLRATARLLEAGGDRERGRPADPGALARGEADLAWVEGRAPRSRLAGAARAELERALDRAAVCRAHALRALGRPGDALAALAALRAARPAALGESGEALERALLVERARAGAPRARDERARLVAALEGWLAGEGQRAGAAELAEVGGLLEAEGALDAAAAALQRAVEAPGAPAARATAHIGRARVALAQGRPDLARVHLDALGADDAQRADARLTRGRLLRAEGQPREAVRALEPVVRSLDVERPPLWWDAVLESALALADAGALPEARRVLEDLRRQDGTFGGDEARRDRFVEVMRSLDARRR